MPSDAVSCVSVPPRSIPLASPGAITSRRGWNLAGRLRPAETAVEGVAVVSGFPARQAPLDHRTMERDDAALERKPARIEVLSL